MQFSTGVLVGVAAWPAFWLVFAILSAILSGCVVKERGIASSICSIALGVMVVAKWQAIIDNPVALVLWVVGYLIVGILWSRFKWSRFLSAKFERFVIVRDNFLKGSGLPKEYLKTGTLDYEQLDNYKRYFRNNFGHGLDCDSNATNAADFNVSLAPKASSNKGSIVMWITYWPVTVVWYIIADIVIDIGKALYNMIGGHFQKMSNQKFTQL